MHAMSNFDLMRPLLASDFFWGKVCQAATGSLSGRVSLVPNALILLERQNHFLYLEMLHCLLVGHFYDEWGKPLHIFFLALLVAIPKDCERPQLLTTSHPQTRNPNIWVFKCETLFKANSAYF